MGQKIKYKIKISFMRKGKSLHFLFFFLISVASFTVEAQIPLRLNVKVDKPIAEIQPTMWGIFFEDINFAADGGIYAELVKNRSFEFSQPLMGWQVKNSDRFSLNEQSGYATIIHDENENDKDETNPRFARVTTTADKGFVMVNEGFRGMGIRGEMQYNFSVLARAHEGGQVVLHVQLVSPDGNVLGETTVSPSALEWKKYTSSFKATATEPKAKLSISFEGKGIVDLDMISLFPDDTWKHRPNGLRTDLVELLADLKPGFLRFPGGCIVEGRDLATRYQWKNTIGNVEDRKLIINRWNTEFNHRPAPDYFQTFGLGFFEYFQLAEDIGAEPLPILSCGMACQFNTAEVVPVSQLDPYVQDALDLIEFANGSVETTWGKLRADMGHPEPFHLKFIGVGNEQWGRDYIERYKIFSKAIKEKYPDITIVSGSGPFPDGELFDYAWESLKSLNAEIVDEHYYRNPQWFLDNADRYDGYDRHGPKIFAGEYAAQSVAIASPDNKNNWECALSEAAFMTGLERNADVVYLASYAPLFAHVEGWQWTPDLIWFDNLRAYGTPNYYVQKLFSNNKGTDVLSVLHNSKPVTGQDELYASAAWDKNAKDIILKIVNVSGKEQPVEIALEGIRRLASSGTMAILQSDRKDAVNSLDHPGNIHPVEKTIDVKGKKVLLSVSPLSLTVLKLKSL
jgi:alpha-N-arabinofuranosidase